MNLRIKLLIGFTAACVAAAVLLPAVPQPLDYHDFADQRSLFEVDHFLNVFSNIGFLIAGVLGLGLLVMRRVHFEFKREQWPYLIFFFGLFATAFGSTYYHLAPDNERLFWDRLPMTVAFMALVSSQITDRISVRAGLALLGPLLLVGAASVIYWLVTERQGAGNVLPYGILQAYAVVVLLLMAILQPSRYTRGSDLYWIFGWYVLSKLLETFDAEVLAHGHIVSGHTLKHITAAFAGFVACYKLMSRKLKRPATVA
jgi:hypothetical protein